MNYGATLGKALCAAATGSGWFLAGGFVGIGLFTFVDIPFRLTPSDPPFQWVEPMMWTALGCGVVGALLGASRAWYHLSAAPKRADSSTSPNASTVRRSVGTRGG